MSLKIRVICKANSFLGALKEKFSSFNSPSSAQNMTLKEYATLVIKNNKMQDSITAQEDESGQVYFTYFKNVSGKDFYYFAVVKKRNRCVLVVPVCM